MSNISQINDQLINAASASFVNGNVFTSTNPALSASYALSSSQTISSSYALSASYSTSASYALSSSNAISASFTYTSSYLTDLSQSLSISGSVTINGNLTVNGTASYTYITASQLDVGTNTISVNVAEPGERFGGLLVYDSGSLSHQATASLLWDSLHNHWVYQNASGSTYSGGMLMSGPRNLGALGDEPTLTKWFVTRGDGGDHLNDTQIFSSGSTHIVTGSLTVTEYITGSFTGSLQGTASWADSASQALTASYVVGSIFDSTNPVLSASYALTASYAMNGGGGGGGNITLIQAGNGIEVINGAGPTVTVSSNLGLTYAISLGYLMP
jgi:hypothetical protein